MYTAGAHRIYALAVLGIGVALAMCRLNPRTSPPPVRIFIAVSSTQLVREVSSSICRGRTHRVNPGSSRAARA
jgi:hypothetical protein